MPNHLSTTQLNVIERSILDSERNRYHDVHIGTSEARALFEFAKIGMETVQAARLAENPTGAVTR